MQCHYKNVWQCWCHSCAEQKQLQGLGKGTRERLCWGQRWGGNAKQSSRSYRQGKVCPLVLFSSVVLFFPLDCPEDTSPQKSWKWMCRLRSLSWWVSWRDQAPLTSWYLGWDCWIWCQCLWGTSSALSQRPPNLDHVGHIRLSNAFAFQTLLTWGVF